MEFALDDDAVASLDSLAGRLWDGTEPPTGRERFWTQLESVVASDLVSAWRDAPRRQSPPEMEPVATFSDRECSESGIYTTPPELARNMARLATLEPGDTVVDPAAGDGRLLEAALAEAPDISVLGVERRPRLALAAAIRVLASRRRYGGTIDGDRIEVGDGLARATGARGAEVADAVLINPPYLREKGRSSYFDELRRNHPHLRKWIGARVDVAYLFLHRALDLLADRGRLVALTTQYWLTATGADRLREDLAERARAEAFVRPADESIFPEAPGQHSLVSVWIRGATDSAAPRVAELPIEQNWAYLRADRDSTDDGSELRRAAPDALEGERWTPFVERTTAEWGRRWEEAGTELSELVDDRQGIVSGGDRVSARRLGSMDDPPPELEAGDPLFVRNADELDGPLAELKGTVVRPMLRGSHLRANSIRVVPPDEEYLFYIDGPLDDDQRDVVEPLEPMKGPLRQRREVRQGKMPWYRLHWPRDRAEQTGPKLVVPRRARTPRFALDLSASVVSSDCTYLVPPDCAAEPVRYLIVLMVALNSAEVERWLREFGKTKGDHLEFYSDPLRSLPVPLENREGELAWCSDVLEASRLETLERRASRLNS